MNKFIIILLSYLVVLLNIKIDGRMVEIGLKIKEDWEEKRIYLFKKNSNKRTFCIDNECKTK